MVYWIWLTLLPSIGPVTARRLLDRFGNPKAIYDADMDELRGISRISDRQKESIITHRSLETAEKIIKECKSQ